MDVEGLHFLVARLQETGAQGERTHVGLFTELGVLYATYDSAKLMDHCKQHKARMNIPRLIRTCEKCCLWKEAVYLHTIYDEYEQAANCMILHPTAWQHDQFIQVCLSLPVCSLRPQPSHAGRQNAKGHSAFAIEAPTGSGTS